MSSQTSLTYSEIDPTQAGERSRQTSREALLQQGSPSPIPISSKLSDGAQALGARIGVSRIEGLFTVLMCADCQAARGHGTGPYPVMTRAQMRAGLDLLPTWALEQKVAANHRVIVA